jgi:hypothetical protein
VQANFFSLPLVLLCVQAVLVIVTSRVLAIGLHPHLIGVPHRIGYLDKMLDLLVKRDDVVFMQGRDIADWFMSVCPAN